MKVLLTALALTWPAVAVAEVTVSDPWARASILASRPGAAYLTLRSDVADQLVGIKSPVAAEVMIHAVETDAAGISRMMHLDRLALEPDVPVMLAPGAMHVMLMGLTEKLEEGAAFPLTLSFQEAGEMTVEVPILGPGASGPEAE
ncbi:MAG: copper chaperone PCu(A)C [Paracoccus sp. (in: a-proteobacteria)]|uniref:copper chaperone PCu(A)C n=1 Tax=Paracoccus sp. TaxID=267 RepID=UPI003241CB15